MKYLVTLALAVPAVVAFPKLQLDKIAELASRQKAPKACGTTATCGKTGKAVSSVTNGQISYDPSSPAVAVSEARSNCGFQSGPSGADTCTLAGFNPTLQYPSITGSYAYASPAKGQLRGPCPGLNAAANHGYLPRDGVASIPETVTGLMDLYGMNPDLSGFLALYAVAIDGDFLTQSWSIGGPPNPSIPLGLLHQGQGISYAHNKYEGDSSISRCDAYLNNGDAHSLDIDRFTAAWYACPLDKGCNLHDWVVDFAKKSYVGIHQNPLYSAPFFSTTLVSPAAYNFVVNFMSNHSEEAPAGYLSRQNFQTFFAVAGTSPKNFVWKPGQERVPDNWYRRPNVPFATEYTALEGVFGDLIAGWAAVPYSFKFGGNTKGKNSFVGIDLAELTGGKFSTSGVTTDPKTLGCFFYQQFQQVLPDQLQASPNSGISAKVEKAFFKALAGGLNVAADCPQITKYNDNLFGKYPGFKYSPKGRPGQNC